MSLATQAIQPNDVHALELRPARDPGPACQPPTIAQEPRLRLDRNEGPAPRDIETLLAGITSQTLNRYTTARDLEARLAAIFDVHASQVLVTSGGDDAIDRCCRVMLDEKTTSIIHTPTFEMIPRSLARTGATCIEIPWIDGPLPVDSFLQRLTSEVRLIALVTPNNPTGLTISADAVRAIAAAAPQALIMVDLAYIEFAEEDILPAVLEHPNTIAIRTFSKAYGLAGLRIGYALGSASIIDWLRSAGGPYACSSASLAIVDAVLKAQPQPDAALLARIAAERDQLSTLLRERGYRTWPSQANFVLAQAADATELWQQLGERGIAVRRFTEPQSLTDCLRITCPGNDADFALLIGTLRKLLPQ